MFKTFFNRRKTNNNTFVEEALATKNTAVEFKESINVARTNLMYMLSGSEEGKCVLVTSSLPSEGKTSTTINLAVALAQTEARVLLVDADLRRPRIHAYLETSNETGLANYLGGFCDISSIINHSEDFTLDYVTAGTPPPNPSELLSSKRMNEFIEAAAKDYDYVLVDTPPVNVVSDAQILSQLIKNVVLIVRCGTSVNSEVKKAVSTLEFADAKILGFITIDKKKTTRASKYYAAYYNDNN